MLVLGRFRHQRNIIVVPPSTTETIITEMVVREGHGARPTKLGYEAPEGVTIDREEVYQSKMASKAKAGK